MQSVSLPEMQRMKSWFRRLGAEDGGWWQRPRSVRLSWSSWRWKRRPIAEPSSGEGGRRRRWRRRALLDVLYDVMFRVLSFFEALVLGATLCFFYFRFGCQL